MNFRIDKVSLSDGIATTREIVEHRGAVAIIPITDDRRLVLVRQYRYAVATELLEIPAGTLEDGETPEDCAVRELEEETVFKCNEIKKIMEFFVAPGYSTERIHVYLARELTKSRMRTEEDERINVEIIPIENVLERVRSGQIRDAKSICAIYRAAELL